MVKHAVAFGMLCACITASLPGCVDSSTPRTTFRGQKVTTYENILGEVIRVSNHALFINDQRYEASDCSNEEFNCKVYGKVAAFITPRRCYASADITWEVGDIRTTSPAGDIHSGSRLIITTTNKNMGYVFNPSSGEGIIIIEYNTPHGVDMWNYERFLKEQSREEFRIASYYKVSGPAVLPCH